MNREGEENLRKVAAKAKIRSVAEQVKAVALAIAVIATTISAVHVTQLTAYASDKEVEMVWLGKPAHVWWDTETIGAWSTVKKAHEYQVKLYIADDVDRDEENWKNIDVDDLGLEAVMVRRVTENRCDFTEYMNDLHTYFFTVQATPRLNEQAYVVEGSKIASPDINFKGEYVLGITTGKWRNYLEGSRYETEDGDYLTGGWHLIWGTWYFLNEQGYRVNGWQTLDGVRYYFDEYGQMAEGWLQLDGNWYYADSDGAMQTGWVMTEPGCYYYLKEDGVMLHDCDVDGYWLGSNGLCTEYTAK